MDKKSNTDTSAAPNYEGYEYQFLYFLEQVLRLEKDEEVGFELLDDIHLISSNGEKTLIQVKHSILNKQEMRPTFPSLDHDLWKTLTNWITFFSDIKLDIKNEVQEKESIKLSKLDKTYTLIIYTNKRQTNNKFEDILSNSNTIKENRESLEKIKTNTIDEELIARLHFILRLRDSDLNLFLSVMKIEYDTVGLERSIYDYLEGIGILDSKLESILGFLYLQIKRTISNFIDKRIPTLIDFDMKKKMFRKYFDLGRNRFDPLKPIRDSYSTIPNEYKDSIFIQQLLDIGYIEDVEIPEYARKLMDFKDFLLTNLSEGFMVPEEIDSLDENAKTVWKTTFKELYRDLKDEIEKGNTNEEDIDKVALSILDRLHREYLKTYSFDLDISHSNSEFYELSNRPEIGWHYKWKEIYEKK